MVHIFLQNIFWEYICTWVENLAHRPQNVIGHIGPHRFCLREKFMQVYSQKNMLTQVHCQRGRSTQFSLKEVGPHSLLLENQFHIVYCQRSRSTQFTLKEVGPLLRTDSLISTRLRQPSISRRKLSRVYWDVSGQDQTTSLLHDRQVH